MKILLLLLTTSLLTNLTIAQTTAIPDSNFEQALINFGYDTGIPDGTVLTSSIDTVTSLNLYTLFIADLTGIQDFTALKTLSCVSNQLSNLDVSQNTALENLICLANQITTLDVSQNSSLKYLNCSMNPLTILDVSQNTVLTGLSCSANQLTCLNVQNGNNQNFTTFYTLNSPNLTCIEVDDSVWAITNLTNIDPQTSFSNNCGNLCTVDLDDLEHFSNFSIYPNPTTGKISIDLGEIQTNIKATFKNSLGQEILTQQFESTDIINLNIDAPTGIYFLQIEVDGYVITKKIIKE
jgi:hypothetical protein